ncbi:MAG TPA: 3-phosphoshikimate 1-carboxyvinyltransferase [Xanthomonadaceae bacterium]|nr:3-phosphoshikimate 1-carboxyvinyltransferase [Xanthomonadaceae bacterium]
MRLIARRAGQGLGGRTRVPGDKSISHRAVMLGSLADGTTEVEGFLEGEDTRATARAFAAMGVAIEHPEPGRLRIHGRGLRGLQAPSVELDMGNSGTAMRLMAGILAAQAFPSTLIGDASLTQRPMARVTRPLEQMGADIRAREDRFAPLAIRPVAALHGRRFELEVASAQVKSCLLLAGLYADGETTVVEPRATRDHSERMLTAFGAPPRIDGLAVSVRHCASLTATRIAVPADISSAAFPLVAGLLVPGSDIVLTEVGMNPRRTGLLHALERMGADIVVDNARVLGGEPVADLRIRHAPLRGIEVPQALVPDMIDEFPILFIAAACAEGETIVRSAEELRVKESDRIAVMAQGLRTLGVDIEEAADGACIRGGALAGGTVDSAGDHRCAMAFTIAGLVARAPVEVLDCDNVATSFPGFVELMRGLGGAISAQ